MTPGRRSAAAENAARKSELRVVEDQVDAVVCAYVALFATRAPDRTTTYGDFETGYIVTPTLPDDLAPDTPRCAAGTEDPVDRAAVHEYAEMQPELRAGGRPVRTAGDLDPRRRGHQLPHRDRPREVGRVVRGQGGSHRRRTAAFADPLRQITDQIGVRVITYVHSDVQAVADLLDDQVVVHDDRDMGQETASEGRFGYASRHLLVSLDPARADRIRVRAAARPPGAGPDPHRAAARLGRVRARHPLQGHHPRASTSPTSTDGSPSLPACSSSPTASSPRSGTGSGRARPPPSTEPHDDDPRISPRELAAFLAGQYADAGWSRTDHYAWISGLILELGITSLTELGDTLRSVDEETLTARMDYRYPPGAVRRLDDALLWVYGDAYVGLRANAHRAPGLRARLAKMRDSD